MRNCIEAIGSAVVAAWDRLPGAVQAGIVAMVKAAATSS
jgi:hypothetical protein